MTESSKFVELIETVMVEDTMEIVAPEGWREQVKAALEAKAKKQGLEILPETFVTRRTDRGLEEDPDGPETSPWEAAIKAYKP
jgi:hypothetical protein